MNELYGLPTSKPAPQLEPEFSQEKPVFQQGRGHYAPYLGSRLVEVDLDGEAYQRVEEEMRKTETGNASLARPAVKNKKPRMGRDGKPWRDRNRRNSEDLARDQAVEEVYNSMKPEVQDPGLFDVGIDLNDEDRDYIERCKEDGTAIDEFFANKFRDSYMEEGRYLRKAPVPMAGKPGEERAKGPKLGGSRSARAAMRLQEEAGKKK